MHKTVRALFFCCVLCPVEEYGVHLHYIALGHKWNKAEVKAAEFSAPIAIFVIVCRTVYRLSLFFRKVFELCGSRADRAAYMCYDII